MFGYVSASSFRTKICPCHILVNPLRQLLCIRFEGIKHRLDPLHAFIRIILHVSITHVVGQLVIVEHITAAVSITQTQSNTRLVASLSSASGADLSRLCNLLYSSLTSLFER